MVSLEAHKRGGEYVFSTLSLDVKAQRGQPSEHIFLEGSEDCVLFSDLSEFLGESTSSGRRESEMEGAEN